MTQKGHFSHHFPCGPSPWLSKEPNINPLLRNPVFTILWSWDVMKKFCALCFAKKNKYSLILTICNKWPKTMVRMRNPFWQWQGASNSIGAFWVQKYLMRTKEWTRVAHTNSLKRSSISYLIREIFHFSINGKLYFFTWVLTFYLENMDRQSSW